MADYSLTEQDDDELMELHFLCLCLVLVTDPRSSIQSRKETSVTPSGQPYRRLVAKRRLFYQIFLPSSSFLAGFASSLHLPERSVWAKYCQYCAYWILSFRPNFDSFFSHLASKLWKPPRPWLVFASSVACLAARALSVSPRELTGMDPRAWWRARPGQGAPLPLPPSSSSARRRPAGTLRSERVCHSVPEMAQTAAYPSLQDSTCSPSGVLFSVDRFSQIFSSTMCTYRSRKYDVKNFFWTLDHAWQAQYHFGKP